MGRSMKEKIRGGRGGRPGSEGREGGRKACIEPDREERKELKW